MRTLFRVLGFAGFVLVVLSIQVLRSPETPLVLTEVLDDWYGKQMIWCGIIGLAVGGVGAWVAMSRVRHRPKQPASDFLGRVAKVGLVTMLIALVISLLVGMWMAATAGFEGMAPPDKVRLVGSSGKALGLVGATLFGCLLSYAAVTRVAAWGGQYSIVGPNLGRFWSAT